MAPGLTVRHLTNNLGWVVVDGIGVSSLRHCIEQCPWARTERDRNRALPPVPILDQSGTKSGPRNSSWGPLHGSVSSSVGLLVGSAGRYSGPGGHAPDASPGPAALVCRLDLEIEI
jgi:hypothetical protein